MITYRPATRADAPQVQCLLEEIMGDHGVVPPPPDRLSATIAAILVSPAHMFLVAEEEGRLVGMCALLFSQSTWMASPACELQDVIVTRSRRLSEVGRGLLANAEQIARSRGCSRMFLLAESWNFDAHAFYRRNGLSEKTCLYFERVLT
jgi:N-acetylglutamate synthase-like GNAT family acetyltransferase